MRKITNGRVKTLFVRGLLVFAVFLGNVAFLGRDASAQDQEAKMNEMQRALEGIMDELEELKQEGEGGIGEKIRLHGYGELHYNNTDKDGKNDKMDMHRAVIGLSYRFTDRIIFDMEVDFEHAATEMELEYANVSFLFSDALNVRMGSMLMPVAYLNEFHEPVNFHSVERPYVQKYIIPTTWQEGGVGIFGSLPHELRYRLYLVGGLDASKFKASSGIREGRGHVAGAKADDLAIVGRLEYGPVPGLDLGTSVYLGNAGQDGDGLGSIPVSLFELDVRYKWDAFELTGLVTNIAVGDTEDIFAVAGEVIGEEMLGWYLEGAWHIGQFFLKDDEKDMAIFLRYEQFNTQESVASGLASDPANDRQVTTFGLAYYPIYQVAIKADLELWSDDAGDDWQQFNVGLAYEY